MKKYSPQNIILSSRFVNLWQQETQPFRDWTLQRVAELIADNQGTSLNGTPENDAINYCNKAIFFHMRNLLTAIAIHEWDITHGMSPEASIHRLGKAMEDYMLHSRKRFQQLLQQRLVFRIAGMIIPRIMTRANGKGFSTTPVKVKGGFGFNTTHCPFHTLMNKYGHPDLGRRFCAIDEYMYGQIPNVRFERQGTLCRGCSCCDFRFYWKGR